MDPITPGNRSRETKPGDQETKPGDQGARPGGQGVSPEVYWRRRVFALAAGLAVLGLLAWAIGGASSAHPAASTTSFSNQSQAPFTPSAFPAPATSSASPSPSPSPSSSGASPSPSPSGSQAAAKKTKAAAPKQSAKKQSARKQSAQKHAGRRRPPAGLNALGDDCPASDVVLTLVASGETFSATARPEFTMTVVSTASRTCQFNVGPRYLSLVIESGGVREWGSGDCVRGGGSKVAMLTRGVPVQRKLTWNRTLSAPGCHLLASAARPGTYTASASDAGVHSHTVVFELR